MFNQNSGVVPKYRARRSAVSPVMPRRSAMIACTRVTGTPMSLASRYAVRPSGFMNSSRNCSPGWIGGRSRMFSPPVVVDDFDALSTSISPNEAEAPLIVDPNAILTRAAAAQRLQPISGRSGQIAQFFCIMELPQFSLRRALNIARQPRCELAMEQGLGLPVGKRADHSCRLIYGSRSDRQAFIFATGGTG